MKKFIQNVSMKDIKSGYHYDAGSNSMLIQITDPAYGFPIPKYPFKEIHQFEFLDAEEGDGFEEDVLISKAVAKQIFDCLQHAQTNRMNVIVHCHAGLCRSGAVVEVGVMMGFIDPETTRVPNLRVERMLVECLYNSLGVSEYE